MIATETRLKNSETDVTWKSEVNLAAGSGAISLWLVDDNESFREMLAENFELEQNIECARQFPSAEALLETLARETPPDVILLDNSMGGMSGVEAVPLIKTAAPATRVLMLTTFFDASAQSEAMRNGASGFLLKSYDFHRIAASVRKASDIHADNADNLKQTREFQNLATVPAKSDAARQSKTVGAKKSAGAFETLVSSGARSFQRLFQSLGKQTIATTK